MSEYKKYFEAYCREHDLELRLSFEMPIGYETANGTFDVSSRTVFINAEKLNDIIQKINVEMPFLSKFVVLLELVRPDDIAVHRFNSRRASSTSE